MNKEEIIAAIKECAEKIGHVPSSTDLHRVKGIGMYPIRRGFGSWGKALRAAGLELVRGIRVPMRTLFEEWAELVRQTGQIPTLPEYELSTKRSGRPLRNRFGTWTEIPGGILKYAESSGLQQDWGDVLEIAREYCRISGKPGSRITRLSTETPSAPARPKMLPDRPVYGPALMAMPLAHGPVNEMGVLFLFGALARQLGFIVTRIGTEFPDCEAMREVEPGRHQRVLVELEYESRNFLRHRHDETKCDVIVCWEHNWPECPLEVVELRRYVPRQLRGEE